MSNTEGAMIEDVKVKIRFSHHQDRDVALKIVSLSK